MREHTLQYMVMTGTTLARVSDEAVESAHSKIRKREEKFNLKDSKNHSGENKLKRSLQLISIHNALNSGFFTKKSS